MLYEVSFEKDGVCQVHKVETKKSPVYIGRWYRDVHGVTAVYGIKISETSLKPGQPIIQL